MNKSEKAFMIFCLLYSVVHIPFLMYVTKAIAPALLLTQVLCVSHGLWIVLLIAAFILTIRDLYKRSFPNPNSKVTWVLIIVLTSGLGLFLYIFKHGFRPRTLPSEEAKGRDTERE